MTLFFWDTLGPEDWRFWQIMEHYDVTEAWRSHPIGGEVYPQLQAGIWDRWPNSEGQDVKTAITRTHATWMLDSGLFTTEPKTEQRGNALRAERMLGYVLYCAAAQTIRAKDGSLAISVRIENRGVAPMYYDWPVELEALDPGGKVVVQSHVEWPLSTLLPGRRVEWNAVLSGSVQSARTVLLQIANPMPGGHPLAFANSEMGTVKQGWLTLAVLDSQ